MPRYFFTIHRGDQVEDDPDGTSDTDEAAIALTAPAVKREAAENCI